MSKPEGREELHNFLQEKHIKDAIEREDLAYVYNKMPSGNRWMLTELLYSLDVDPLEYVTQVYSQMFVYHEGDTLVLPKNIEFVDWYAFQLSEITTLRVENNNCSFDGQCFSGMNPDCKIYWLGNVYDINGRKIRN